MDSKVSVIIPTYNRSHLLAETLDSVYAQTRRDYEIIVVDDGSDDDTPERVGAFSDRMVYHCIKHAGASAARNAGLGLARGEYVAFLDSDDLWESLFLDHMMAALEAAPGAGFCYCDYATFGAQRPEQAAYLPPHHKLSGDVFTPLLETDFLSTGALLIRRACFARVGGFDPALTIAHDWDLWLRLAREFKTEFVDEPLVRIRVHGDGLTRNTLQLKVDNLRVLAKWRRAAARDALQRRIIRRNIHANHRSLSKCYWGAHQPLPALEHLVLSLTSSLI